MGIRGVHSILYESASAVWSGEQQPSERLATVINKLNEKIEKDILVADDHLLTDEMARMTLEPSQEMRLRYFEAYLLRESSPVRDFKRAYQVFEHALYLADQHADLDSQIVLTGQLGLMKYGDALHHEAISHYEVALELWQQRERQLADPSAEPELYFRDRIGVSQFSIGEFDAAEGTLARVLTVVKQRPDVPQTPELRATAAKTLWTLGLIHRAQSDMQDGSETLLLRALERLEEALTTFRNVGEHEVNVGRLHIQIAETCLDLSDWYLQRDQRKQANQARQKARVNIVAAQSIPKYANDAFGPLLTELALLRYEITRTLDADAARGLHAFELRLKALEDLAAEGKSESLSAKCATLRGEWLLWLGDAPHAREAFVLALAGLRPDNMGEATRPQRLLRRSNEEPREQPRAQRTRATGPRVSRPHKRP
jgi:tetratricopeptide (TPR) repeat protein